MKSDVHMHCSFSSDSQTNPEDMIHSAIEKGLQIICFTDHYDKDNFDWGAEDIFDVEAYFPAMKKLQKQYAGQIDIRIGAEIGIQPHLAEHYHQFVREHELDFVIGSAHSVLGHDVATGHLYKGRSDNEAYRLCFEEILKDVNTIPDFDVLGHMDYMVRYSTEKSKGYHPEKYMDIIDEILKTLIAQGRGIEVNTSGWKYGLEFAHPHKTILRRYKELGGEILTIGADGHRPDHIAYGYDIVDELLLDCGFEYYTVFKRRIPEYIKICKNT